jgi:hypothetical protein
MCDWTKGMPLKASPAPMHSSQLTTMSQKHALTVCALLVPLAQILGV